MKRKDPVIDSGISVYPGEYKPLPLDKGKLTKELARPHEGSEEPRVNIIERKNNYWVELAVPGLRKEDFLAKVVNNHLVVYILHKEGKNERKSRVSYLLHDFNYECCKCNVSLPDDADADFVRAEYHEGLLRFYFPKTENPGIGNVQNIPIY